VVSDVVAASGGNHAVFVLLVLVHAATALVGFGSVGFAGTYASRAARMASAPEWWPAVSVAMQRQEGADAPGSAVGLRYKLPVGTVNAEAEVARQVDGETRPEGAKPAEVPRIDDDPEVEELMRYFQRPARFWPAVVIVPVFGLLALWAQPAGEGFSQLWPAAALGVWVVAVIVLVVGVVPGLRQMTALFDFYGRSSLERAVGDPSGPAGTAWRARLARAGARASRGAAACDVLFFVALALMVWQP
jgi:hypothetical protein